VFAILHPGDSFKFYFSKYPHPVNIPESNNPPHTGADQCWALIRNMNRTSGYQGGSWNLLIPFSKKSESWFLNQIMGLKPPVQKTKIVLERF
jgi:hypothetical protein